MLKESVAAYKESRKKDARLWVGVAQNHVHFAEYEHSKYRNFASRLRLVHAIANLERAMAFHDVWKNQ